MEIEHTLFGLFILTAFFVALLATVFDMYDKSIAPIIYIGCGVAILLLLVYLFVLLGPYPPCFNLQNPHL